MRPKTMPSPLMFCGPERSEQLTPIGPASQMETACSSTASVRSGSMAGARFFGSIRQCTVIIAESIAILSRLSARSINSVSTFSIMSFASSSAPEAPNLIVRDINGRQRLLPFSPRACRRTVGIR